MEEQRDAPARPLWVRIQTIRTERGWSWERLERELGGVSRTTIDKWKKARRPPQAATVNTVARKLGIDHEEALRLAGILPPEPEPTKPTVEEMENRVAELEREVAELQAERNKRVELEHEVIQLRAEVDRHRDIG